MTSSYSAGVSTSLTASRPGTTLMYWPNRVNLRSCRRRCTAPEVRLACAHSAESQLRLIVRLVHPDAEGLAKDRAQAVPDPTAGVVRKFRNIAVGKDGHGRAATGLPDRKLDSCHGALHPRAQEDSVGSAGSGHLWWKLASQ